MRRKCLGMAAMLIFVLLASAQGWAQPATTQKSFTRKEDVIYGRVDGTALTMDVFVPVEGKGNGRGVIFVVSGGWFSAKQMTAGLFEERFVQPLVGHGYTVFAVVHGSQPRYTINEIVPMVRRGVKYIRANAKQYGVDPEKLGICGGSAGGHLSLMISTEAEAGKADAPDLVDREPAKVAAAAVFFPPTDFLNYGETGKVEMGKGVLKDFRAPFDFREMSKKSKAYERVTDARAEEILKEISPAWHVGKASAPALIIHGDADTLVPVQQARVYADAMKKAGVEVKVSERAGMGHGWADARGDMEEINAWFDRWLQPQRGGR